MRSAAGRALFPRILDVMEARSAAVLRRLFDDARLSVTQRYGFANAVGEEEAKQLYEDFAVPASGKSLWQAAAANLNPWTERTRSTPRPRPWAAAAHLRRAGPHRPAGHRRRPARSNAVTWSMA